MVRKLLCTNGSRQNTDRKFHFRNYIRFRKNSTAAVLNTGLHKPPCRIAYDQPWKILNITDWFLFHATPNINQYVNTWIAGDAKFQNIPNLESRISASNSYFAIQKIRYRLEKFSFNTYLILLNIDLTPLNFTRNHIDYTTNDIYKLDVFHFSVF